MSWTLARPPRGEPLASFAVRTGGRVLRHLGLVCCRVSPALAGAQVYGNPVVRACSAAQSDAASPATAWHLDHIGVRALHHEGWTGAGVVVGILDSGVSAAHPDLRGKPIHYASFDEEGRRTDGPPHDYGVHGTHAAGLVASDAWGVAPGATLAVAAVLTLHGGTAGRLVQLAAGVDWLIGTRFRGADHPPGCDIINAGVQVLGYNAFLRDALVRAERDPGVLMIAAIGNHATRFPGRLASPANYDLVVGVGATDADDRPAPFSQFGYVDAERGIPKPDLCAPGVAITSCVPGDGVTALSGTSQASPLVAGGGALLLQRDKRLVRDVPALRSEILASVVPLPEAGVAGGRGRLDLRRMAPWRRSDMA